MVGGSQEPGFTPISIHLTTPLHSQRIPAAQQQEPNSISNVIRLCRIPFAIPVTKKKPVPYSIRGKTFPVTRTLAFHLWITKLICFFDACSHFESVPLFGSQKINTLYFTDNGRRQAGCAQCKDHSILALFSQKSTLFPSTHTQAQ